MQTYIVVIRLLLSLGLSLLQLMLPPQKSVGRMTAEVRRRKQQRLDALNEQAATYGVDVPPHVTTEIEDLERELETVGILERGQLDQPLRDLLGRFDERDLIGMFNADVMRRIRTLENGLSDLAETFREDSQKRQADRNRGALITGFMAAMMFVVLVLVILLLIVGLR